MNLSHLLSARHVAGKPVRVALIGAGKFGSMFLSQVPHTPGLEVPVIVDLDPDRAREACRTVGWDKERIAATTFTDDGAKATSGNIEVIVEAHRQSGRRYPACARGDCRRQAYRHGQCRGRRAGRAVARGRSAQGRRGVFARLWRPAGADRRDGRLARATGFRVVAAGKGTKYLPAYHDVTPAGVWAHYGLTAGEAQSAGMNPQMFNSFLDGTNPRSKWPP